VGFFLAGVGFKTHDTDQGIRELSPTKLRGRMVAVDVVMTALGNILQCVSWMEIDDLAGNRVLLRPDWNSLCDGRHRIPSYWGAITVHVHESIRRSSSGNPGRGLGCWRVSCALAV
jgi:hypothetical protein